jgi:peptidyl-tRNA hydrolase
MTVYDSASIYLDSRTTVRAKITAIDAIIAALLTTAVKAAAGENITEYWLDDGQTKIKTVRRTSKEIEASIAAFERLKQYYVNQLNGRVFRMIDSKNFNIGRC